MPTLPQLEWRTMTDVTEELKSSNRFLRDLLFSDEEALMTETVDYDVITSDRAMAPFIKKNAKGIMVDGYGETFNTVDTPFISIVRPLEACQAFFKRFPGTDVYATAAEQEAAIDARVKRDLDRLVDLRDNAIEWLCAQAIRGTISYVTGQAAFTLAFPKPGGNNITLATFWDQPNSLVSANFLTAKKVISDETGLAPTHAIFGDEAAAAFLQHPDVLGKVDIANVKIGNIDFTTQFTALGGLFLGMFSGIQCWYYPRTVINAGVAEPLIRSKYVEFVTATPAAKNKLFFGAIADWDAKEQGLIATPSFSKSWKKPDPSVWMSQLKSRPLPVPRRPGSMVSMKVVSG